MGTTKGPPSAATAFGLRVRARRVAFGWSQEQLAEAAGLHSTYISSVERGRCNVSLGVTLKLAHALDVDPGELVAGL